MHSGPGETASRLLSGWSAPRRDPMPLTYRREDTKKPPRYVLRRTGRAAFQMLLLASPLGTTVFYIDMILPDT